MESDHYKTRGIYRTAPPEQPDRAIVAEMIAATKSIESDHYKALCWAKPLTSVTCRPRRTSVYSNPSAPWSRITKAQILNQLISSKLSPETQTTLMDLMTSFESDHYLNTVATNMLKSQSLTDASFQKLVSVIGHQESDFYLSNFLTEALKQPGIRKGGLGNPHGYFRIESDHYITRF